VSVLNEPLHACSPNKYWIWIRSCHCSNLLPC